MAHHRTDSGSIDLVDSWGHGRAPQRDWTAVPNILTYEDDDGHHSAWRVTGSMRDAARVVADFDLRKKSEPAVASLYGRSCRLEMPPDGFYEHIVDDDGELVETKAHPENFPDVVAWR